jgi:glucose/arabinose dehydrogenase
MNHLTQCAPRIACAFALALSAAAVTAQPILTVNGLTMRTAASGFVTPIAMAFLGQDEFLLLEKNTGKVLHIRDGATIGTALDLNVNFASERGLLGIALHPDFATNGWVYLFWSESTTGADSDGMLTVPLLGNRVDRFVWDGATLTHDHDIIKLRAYQDDATNPEPRANHDGGVLAFGHDDKLYIMFGDVGRRGLMQNNMMGPVPDDQFGGPEPDNAHWSGVIIRLNDDGTTPMDNPFSMFMGMGVEADANIRRTYAYGIRNSFGMAFDPQSGNLWYQENGEDAFDELNIVRPGMNSGWIQIMGPVSRVAEYRKIEMTSTHHEPFPNLQQLRWPPENIATTPAEALSRLFVIPGSTYVDPALSWKHVVAPAAIGFVPGTALGPSFRGDLIMGLSTTDTHGGPLLRFNLTGNRRKVAVDHPELEDRVVDNEDFHELGSTEANVIGTGFGIVTDIKSGPNGRMFVVSLDQGNVYEIWRQ